MAQLTIQQTFDLAVQHHQAGRWRQAEEIYQQILAQQPEHAGALHYLGVIAAQAGRHDMAVDLIRRAIALWPNSAQAYNNLGNALRETGHLDESIAAYRRAIALKSNLHEVYSNLGNVLRDMGQLDEAIAACRQAIALKPDYAEAHYNLAWALLLHGDFEEGWREHEWRWKMRDFPAPNRGFAQPLWDGSDLKGRTIFLYAEQGFGDTIQFMRYVPLVGQRGGRVLIGVPTALNRLLRQLPGVERWIAHGEALGPFDVHCPLMSLPRVFATTLKTIPAQKNLLLSEPALAQAWRRRLEQQPPGLKVGLVWAGSPQQQRDRYRSMALSLLAPLATVEGIHFYSLQKGDAAAQAAHPPAGMRLIDWTDELHDFAETAALVAQMDLIISVCTAVAHLGGAMGKPVWLLLSLIPDWRWLQNRDDTPWYPSMRLFRQSTLGDWPGVIRRVVDALAALRSQKPT